ncbi:hypothetical protein BJX63DRAFT_78164 [Aspergillus granulosus]|uniref:Uncharacterized protein n=1 Tax=Aspergillus granulosus TaxID=176169 RepID=A0ABR4GW18_9EURO
MPTDIVASAVHSYNKNGGNGWDLEGLSEFNSVQDLRRAGLIGRGVRSPGHNTIPLCSAEEAYGNWGDTGVANYPCN